ncbi:hypothetical protein POM88_004400 [Heracleum sosnowskyi]|uniref:Protein FAR1-RELATED SEQUENCE n=1 Tax=Heracleum sosnowskyi TaxID=360622 RepID=A0AAD8JHU2_9APIA|nr:hypothetical protein POM88_004400 [Heracleum sosnowskyi]
MEIDLEHPLGVEEKLDNVADKSTIVLVEEEDLNYSRTHGPVHVNSSRDEVENMAMRGQVLQAGGSWGNINEPRCGLEFESKEAAYSFYREYARLVGFGITIKASRRSKKSGKFIDVKISCSRFGNERTASATSNLRSCPKTDCKASMHIKKRNDGIWFVYGFVKDHNHELHHDDFCLAIRGRKKQSAVIAGQKKGLQLSLDEEDVKVLFEHFMTSQAENRSFLYAIDLDQEKRLRNVFWVDAKGTRNFCVSWSEAESSICCSCRSFEYRGFLCRHALIVLQLSGISNIPSHYILKRWTKDATINQILDKNHKRLHYRVERFNDLCKLAAKLGEKGAVSQESYNIAFCAVEEALKNCVDVNNSVRSPLESNMRNQGLLRVHEESNIGKGSKRKKIQKKQKVRTETELMAIRRQIANQQREVLDERAGSADISYVPQQRMQGMALRSRTPYFDGYFSAQQTAEGEEQMNLIPSMQDGCYTNQQGMHGLLITNPSRAGQFSPHQTLHALGQVSFNAPTVHGHFGFQDSLHDMEETVNSASKHL